MNGRKTDVSFTVSFFKKFEKRKPVIGSPMKNKSDSCTIFFSDRCTNGLGKLNVPLKILLTVFNITDSDARSLPFQLTF